MLLHLIDVRHWFLINMFLRVTFSQCLQALVHWCGFMQPGWKWMVHITVMSCYSNSCCQTSVKLLATFCFPAHHMCARSLSCCDTRLRTSHHTWLTNRLDLSSVDYRLLRVIQECVYQKQQGTSNIADELWLLYSSLFTIHGRSKMIIIIK